LGNRGLLDEIIGENPGDLEEIKQLLMGLYIGFTQKAIVK
jgi:hypothetical protein